MSTQRSSLAVLALSAAVLTLSTGANAQNILDPVRFEQLSTLPGTTGTGQGSWVPPGLEEGLATAILTDQAGQPVYVLEAQMYNMVPMGSWQLPLGGIYGQLFAHQAGPAPMPVGLVNGQWSVTADGRGTVQALIYDINNRDVAIGMFKANFWYGAFDNDIRPEPELYQVSMLGRPDQGNSILGDGGNNTLPPNTMPPPVASGPAVTANGLGAGQPHSLFDDQDPSTFQPGDDGSNDSGFGASALGQGADAQGLSTNQNQAFGSQAGTNPRYGSASTSSEAPEPQAGGVSASSLGQGTAAEMQAQVNQSYKGQMVGGRLRFAAAVPSRRAPEAPEAQDPGNGQGLGIEPDGGQGNASGGLGQTGLPYQASSVGSGQPAGLAADGQNGSMTHSTVSSSNRGTNVGWLQLHWTIFD